MNLQTQLQVVTQRAIDKGQTSVKLLSAKTRLSPAHVSNVLHGKRAPSITAYEALLAAVDWTVQILPRKMR